MRTLRAPLHAVDLGTRKRVSLKYGTLIHTVGESSQHVGKGAEERYQVECFASADEGRTWKRVQFTVVSQDVWDEACGWLPDHEALVHAQGGS